MSPSAMAPGGPGLCPLSHPRAQMSTTQQTEKAELLPRPGHPTTLPVAQPKDMVATTQGFLKSKQAAKQLEQTQSQIFKC